MPKRTLGHPDLMRLWLKHMSFTKGYPMMSAYGLMRKPKRSAGLQETAQAFEFCLPTAAKAVPDGPDWIHKIKYDGYRLRVERNGKSVRRITRNGHNWTDRFPWIVQAALKNREQQFIVDGEAVVLGVDGVSDFNALH